MTNQTNSKDHDKNHKKHGIAGYHGRGMPLGSYALLVAVYNLLLGGLLKGTARRPVRLGTRDLILLALSTHKLSRIITKDAVTAPLRAPFTRYKEDLGYGEVNETARGRNLKRAVAELLSCNYCADMWIGLAGMAALHYFPDPSRTAMTLFATVTGADFLHVAYESSRTQSNVLTLEEEEREEKRAA